MEEHSRKPLKVGRNIGGYDIVRVIGQGGFGIVYEGLNRTTRERVAIKQFYPSAIATWQQGIVVDRDDDKALVAKVLKRFEDEAALQFGFTHPNILRVKNFIRADNTGYMITDYVDGGSLLDMLQPYGSVFPNEDAFRRTMEPILDALHYVHVRGTLHRDISPDNIMVDSSGKAILVDFGAAKIDLRANAAISSVLQFREDYAPIEQQFPSAERKEGYYTDIFAVAGTMYRLLSGTAPARAVARAVDGKDPYIPIGLIAKTRCSDAVYAAIDRGLAMKASARPTTVAQFLQLLGWEQPRPPGGPPRLPNAEKVATEVSAQPSLSAVHPSPFAPQWVPDPGGPEPKPAAENDNRPPQVQATPAKAELPPEDQQQPQQQRRSAWRSYLWVLIILGGCVALLRMISDRGVIPPSAVTLNFRILQDTDLSGRNFAETQEHGATNWQDCEAACAQQTGCLGYSYKKWDKRCHLKQELKSQRFEPGSTAAVRQDQPMPPAATTVRSIELVQRGMTGNRYSASSAASFRACSAICEQEDNCIGFQFTNGACWRYDTIDELTRLEAVGGIKHQAAAP